MSLLKTEGLRLKIETPLTEEVIESLKVGDMVLINGYVYTARDAAHKKIVELIKNDAPLPFSLKGQIIYYVGPTPAPPGKVIGSAGPTTSSRMDSYTPLLLSLGLKGMIGKGQRSEEVKRAIKQYKAVYFLATGGAGALLSRHIISSEEIAFSELGTESIKKLLFKDFPVIVAIDCHGGDIFKKL
ncbi:MAG: Fe-S-containing hydro-lyase [Thermodesulfovibrio sp.]|jgi:fumarate hydratase subunit beta|uniref:Fe-S-containing hydro-lyase n=1 Tax=unclassified Thermodesulfovibrio TaxID=2645936 RepID=UPI00083B72D0|nr:MULTISPECIES: Fe-S-containing hydro-lyase [unclassified Thermodesulfovibrio]MDI1472736.1 Fe-S-containing hydro-lyase [Thermodesulfovibrio sp. 1176]MDI6713434.1 Fe-S-containing hydro-lyase [Thermodesulfovibrio sp.]ODA44473.1 Fumarate hydratase, beta subunit [Thermodesulfovibrio sp. N1]